MDKKLNNYTINDFLKLKPIIYEYCVNLTQKKGESFWQRDFSDANDLYQEVFLYVSDNYFNKPKEPCNEGKFVQIMKNCTYWTFTKRFKMANATIYKNLNRIDDSSKDLFLFEKEQYYTPSYNLEELKNSIDFKYYTRKLNKKELNAIFMFLEGYSIIEIEKKLGLYKNQFVYLLTAKLRKEVTKEPINLIDIDKIKHLLNNDSTR